ncbi:MAG: Lrp/AsnC family transcriptional regulator, partial [Chloroflexi bacterium]|nr:Lrp/AsnC family transcriptional regulator [Chloroflexota bacterium]
MTTAIIPVRFDDPVNAAILAVAEDKLQGFQQDPLGEISRRSGVELTVVIERIGEMVRTGTIRRVRQTLLSTNLAQGSLVAWQVPANKLHAAFDYMFQRDPFSGHIVVRTTDGDASGSAYKLWSTLKVPQGYSIEKHCDYLAAQTGAGRYRLMPAKVLFSLGVGHTRRRDLTPGSRSDGPADVKDTTIVELDKLEWRVLLALKREFEPHEIGQQLWLPRAEEAGVPLERFYAVAERLNERGVIGRFSTFLEHHKPVAGGKRVTRYNALFHWAVPPGRELEAGREVGRHHVMTHAYWREGGPEFRNVNVMGVAHGTDKALLLEHK